MSDTDDNSVLNGNIGDLEQAWRRQLGESNQTKDDSDFNHGTFNSVIGSVLNVCSAMFTGTFSGFSDDLVNGVPISAAINAYKLSIAQTWIGALGLFAMAYLNYGKMAGMKVSSIIDIGVHSTFGLGNLILGVLAFVVYLQNGNGRTAGHASGDSGVPSSGNTTTPQAVGIKSGGTGQIQEGSVGVWEFGAFMNLAVGIFYLHSVVHLVMARRKRMRSESGEGGYFPLQDQ